MSGAAWSTVASAITALGLLVVYFASKRHEEDIDDSNSLSTQISAIGEAAVGVVQASSSVSVFVQSMIEPLKVEIVQMRAKEAECVQRIDNLEKQVDDVVAYVSALRLQVRQLGVEPVAPPDLLGFQFD